MTIILVRHGETALNVDRVVQPAATPLNAHGLAQAEAVARRFAGMGVGAILSSDLPRALATAQAIGSACGVAVQTTPLLHERNFGDWRGQPYDAIGHAVITGDVAPPNGESAAQFAERVARAFETAVRLRATLPAPLVVVTHGLVIRAMLDRHCQLAVESPGALANTAVSILAAGAPHAVSLFGCTSHLSGPDNAAVVARAGAPA
ncbi:MAG: histidine phosphatase family protein [Burkholderiaceae bacterium]